ncbi:hypothetical protein BBJ28_00022216 [Nothophytophthora sp. Chile5]|nr:hypothetical protein BBJ28_00022216 [Nothophytophthora sp. Chile5]
MLPNAPTEMSPDAATSPPPTCQICFDELPLLALDGPTQSPSWVTRFCSSKCPAVLCISCLKRYVQVALLVPYPGALPKIRCPICLVLVNKTRWARFLDHANAEDMAMRTQYATLCCRPCIFRCPGCDDDEYVHLPGYRKDENANYIIKRPKLQPSEKVLIPELRKTAGLFCRHTESTSARDVVRFLVDRFPEKKVRRLLQWLLQCIRDDERRATLLLAYHSVYRLAVTLCCGARVCFNCKRQLSNEDEEETTCKCEQGDVWPEIDDDDCVQCRSCCVMLVKVEGCSSVRCACGFAMDWNHELQTRNLFQRTLLPIDPFDTTAFEHWEVWHCRILSGDFGLRRVSMKLRNLAKTRPRVLAALRRFIWRRRFGKLIKTAVPEIRTQLVARACRESPVLMEALRTLVWRRRRFHRALLAECRRAANHDRAPPTQVAQLQPLMVAFVANYLPPGSSYRTTSARVAVAPPVLPKFEGTTFVF